MHHYFDQAITVSDDSPITMSDDSPIIMSNSPITMSDDSPTMSDDSLAGWAGWMVRLGLTRPVLGVELLVGGGLGEGGCGWPRG